MSFKLWPSDASGGVEKAVYVAFYLIVPTVLVMGYATMWGFWHNFYYESVKAASSGWHTLGTIFFVASVVWLYLASQEIIAFNSKGDVAYRWIGFALLTAASWLSYGAWPL
jgi:hypothetical protein